MNAVRMEFEVGSEVVALEGGDGVDEDLAEGVAAKEGEDGGGVRTEVDEGVSAGLAYD